MNNPDLEGKSGLIRGEARYRMNRQSTIDNRLLFSDIPFGGIDMSDSLITWRKRQMPDCDPGCSYRTSIPESSFVMKPQKTSMRKLEE